MEQETISSAELATLNDAIRKKIPNVPQPHLFLISEGAMGLPPEKLSILVEMVKSFDSFSEDIDPRGEHDLVVVNLDGVKFYAKFDYFDEQLKYYKPGGRHVLTLLRADEW